jgi:hypothetical protein
MNIKTKYSIGDEVYYFDNEGNVLNAEIKIIQYTRSDFDEQTWYWLLDDTEGYREDQLFKRAKDIYKEIEKDIKEADKK